ncbi:unnamed protein product, partial [Prorocentrum cordatum]
GLLFELGAPAAPAPRGAHAEWASAACGDSPSSGRRVPSQQRRRAPSGGRWLEHPRSVSRELVREAEECAALRQTCVHTRLTVVYVGFASGCPVSHTMDMHWLKRCYGGCLVLAYMEYCHSPEAAAMAPCSGLLSCRGEQCVGRCGPHHLFTLLEVDGGYSHGSVELCIEVVGNTVEMMLMHGARRADMQDFAAAFRATGRPRRSCALASAESIALGWDLKIADLCDWMCFLLDAPGTALGPEQLWDFLGHGPARRPPPARPVPQAGPGQLAHPVPPALPADDDGDAVFAESPPLAPPERSAPSRTADQAMVRRAMMEAVRQDGRALEFVGEELQADREIVLSAVALDGRAVQFASPDLRADRRVALAAVLQDWRALEHLDDRLRASREVVGAAVAQSGRAMRYALGDLCADRGFALEAASRDGLALEHLAPSLKADAEVVTVAVSQCGRALQFAEAGLRADPGVVLAAVAQDWHAFGHAAPSLRADRSFVLRAVGLHWACFQYAALEVRADGGAVTQALDCDWRVLQHSAAEVRADRAVVLAAVRKSGWALEFAAEELKKDMEVVAAAVGQDWRALGSAAMELRADRQLVLSAVSQCGRALQFAAPELRSDCEVVAAAVRQSELALQYASVPSLPQLAAAPVPADGAAEAEAGVGEACLAASG